MLFITSILRKPKKVSGSLTVDKVSSMISRTPRGVVVPVRKSDAVF
jgi:hypothetical protein